MIGYFIFGLNKQQIKKDGFEHHILIDQPRFSFVIGGHAIQAHFVKVSPFIDSNDHMQLAPLNLFAGTRMEVGHIPPILRIRELWLFRRGILLKRPFCSPKQGPRIS